MVPRVALVSCELRAALVRSGWAGAPQRGRGNGGKVVRKRGGDDENSSVVVCFVGTQYYKYPALRFCSL